MEVKFQPLASSYCDSYPVGEFHRVASVILLSSHLYYLLKSIFPTSANHAPYLRQHEDCFPSVLRCVKKMFKTRQDHLSLDLKSVKKKIKILTTGVKQIYDENMCDINGVAGKKLEHPFSKTEGGSSSSGESNTSKVAEEKVVVGFKEKVETLMGMLLDNGEGGRLEIISIVGAAGGGKTTLAREVYDHPLTSHTFEIRAWVNVSQDYDKTMKRNLLTRILEQASPTNHGDDKKSTEDKLGEGTSPKKLGEEEKISEDELGEKTYICLKGKKYLIVMDDIWGIQAWNDIQRSLPKECNGSKVLFTSRLLVEPNGIHSVPHRLAPLPKSCSWELLQKKVFGKKCCPPELVGIGEHIAEKCEGLPLAIVAIAGILAVEDKTLDMWKDVSKCLSSIIAKNQDGCMEILELSYTHLPLHLKACFVYIGGFPEDSEIIVRELIWLWIAEGFIQQGECDKSLEDIAKDYLSSLIDRSLVMVARKRSFGGIKTCRIHDLLRELCLKKAEEDNFLMQSYENDTFSPSSAPKYRRLFTGSQIFYEYSFKHCLSNLRSFLCLSLKFKPQLAFFFVENLELLRVLHLNFPVDGYHGYIRRGRLVHLRYLAHRLPSDTLDFVSPFSYLFNLETLNLKHWPKRWSNLDWKTILLPRDIFKMVKLRHLHAKRGVFKYHLSCLYPYIEDGIDFDRSSKLDSLQTLHSICPCEECRNFLVSTPNLRKLGFYGDLISNDYVMKLPDLEFLKCLETLSFKHCGRLNKATTFPPMLKFPVTVTRLTLENTGLMWEELSILQTLPSLEALRLSRAACHGQIWDTSELEEGFSQLKYLRLQDLDIEEWNASEDQFPRLEVLVVKYCRSLKRIPIEFANLYELRKIEVMWSRCSVEYSAKEIQEEQKYTRGDIECMNLLAISNVL
ncbi:putative late blight resistance protein homolog R1B-8 [Rhododendron vialii]|uniref:putative late blight resistance protein homolog R1B-8 n=1 Tax=Rhododendron vialii TaxID=182163 RepID=UPI00265EE22C|nr:putative late blight resistance protein homolog R1B-8 [Rhododendron vialii]